MDNWQGGFQVALLKWLQRSRPEAYAIVGWEEEIDGYAFEGGCDTCGHGRGEVYELTIRYTTLSAEDGIRVYATDVTFGDILAELVKLG